MMKLFLYLLFHKTGKIQAFWSESFLPITKRKKFILSVNLFILVTMAMFGQEEKDIPVMNFTQFEKYLHQNNDTTYVVNFWATWCIPCRKELPAFQKAHEKYLNQKVRILLISLDMPTQKETSLIPFLAKNNITAKVILLDDPASNVWIDKVDPSWSGSVPATLIYNSGFREFFEQEFDEASINSIIEKTIKQNQL